MTVTVFKKFALAAVALSGSISFAAGSKEQGAIDFLWAQPDSARSVDYNSPEAPRDGGFHVGMGDWIKYYQDSKFQFLVSNKLPPYEGYNFVISQISCAVDYMSPGGSPYGKDARLLNLNPPVYYGKTAVWEASEKKCANAIACSFEVWIEGLTTPDSRRQFGPYVITGSTTAPNYDCIVSASTSIDPN